MPSWTAIFAATNDAMTTDIIGDGPPLSRTERQKQTIRDFFRVYTQEGVAESMRFLADDATWSFPARSRMRAHFDKVGAEKNFTRIMAMFDGPMEYRIHSMTAEDDRVAVEFEGMGKLKIGRDYNNLYHFLFTFRDGLIVSIKEYFDTLYVIETLPLGTR